MCAAVARFRDAIIYLSRIGGCPHPQPLPTRGRGGVLVLGVALVAARGFLRLLASFLDFPAVSAYAQA